MAVSRQQRSVKMSYKQGHEFNVAKYARGFIKNVPYREHTKSVGSEKYIIGF